MVKITNTFETMIGHMHLSRCIPQCFLFEDRFSGVLIAIKVNVELVIDHYRPLNKKARRYKPNLQL